MPKKYLITYIKNKKMNLLQLKMIINGLEAENNPENRSLIAFYKDLLRDELEKIVNIAYDKLISELN